MSRHLKTQGGTITSHKPSVPANDVRTPGIRGPDAVFLKWQQSSSGDVLALYTIVKAGHPAYSSVFNRMALTKITDKQLLDFVTALVPENEGGEDNARTKKIRSEVLALHESGKGAELLRGTLWGAFNCVTEYTDHAMEGNPTTRLESIWFGYGEQLKLMAFQLAERMFTSRERRASWD